MTGSVNFSHLPEEVQVIDLRNNNLTGGIEIAHLPD